MSDSPRLGRNPAPTPTSGGADRGDGVELRDLVSIEEMRACVALQEETWGQGFTERVPLSILKVGQRLGGVSAGAFLPDGRLVGFVFGLTGLTPEGPAHWSDMLAVTPDFRRRGIGLRLKLFQRERVLSLGVRTMYWTFDPLEVRNAQLNLRRLGGYGSEYVVDMYGPSVSPLHLGLATDRLVVRWDLDSRRVARALAGTVTEGSGGVEPGGVRAFDLVREGDWPAPSGPIRPVPPDRVYVVPVPRRIGELHAARPELARGWRMACREALSVALSAGGRVLDVVPDRGECAYLVFPEPMTGRER